MLGLDNPIHIAFLLALLLLVFGAKRLPEMGKSLGSGLRGFKESLSGADTAPPSQAPPLGEAPETATPFQAPPLGEAPETATVDERTHEVLGARH